MKIIIAGSRSFSSYLLLREEVDKFILEQMIPRNQVEIVSGTAKGADQLGEKYAAERGYPVKTFPAPWHEIQDKPENQIGIRRDGSMYWKIAGHVRNGQMADYADALIAFSKGTPGIFNMIKQATAKKLTIKIITQ